MSFNQFDTPEVLAVIKAIDDAYAGKMKKAAMVAGLAQFNSGQPAAIFDPHDQMSYIRYTDEHLPGSMKDAGIVYMIAQMVYNPHVLDAGLATLAGGTATVLTTNADSQNPILLTYYSATTGGSLLNYNTVVDGVSFNINSSNPADAGIVSWMIIRG